MGYCTYFGQIDGSIEFFGIAITGVALAARLRNKPCTRLTATYLGRDCGGNSICGNSAIAAVAPIIGADSDAQQENTSESGDSKEGGTNRALP
jgi:hypothetical protein